MKNDLNDQILKIWINTEWQYLELFCLIFKKWDKIVPFFVPPSYAFIL